MTHDDLILLAQKSGFLQHMGVIAIPNIDNLKRFATLVAAAEREACAKVCEDWPMDEEYVYSIGVAIRARGEK